MSVLVVGISHRTSPVAVLERAALVDDELIKFVQDVALAPAISEVVVLSTCNRVEVYAEVQKFHTAVAEIRELLAQHSGMTVDGLSTHLYVHYEERAVHHLFSVTCGLDSMAVGEAQIVGQVKDALTLAQELGTAGSVLNGLLQHALRVGKRAHRETDIDKAGQSLVSLGLRRTGEVTGRSALVVGAGSMSALAAATLQRAGARPIVIVNRTYEHGRRLAGQVGGKAVRLSDLPAAIVDADLIVSCTGATGTVIDHATIEAAMRKRGGRPLAILDLALPRDVESSVRNIRNVTVIDLETIGTAEVAAPAVRAVRSIVDDEVKAYTAEQESAKVTPTVVALRAHAEVVIATELARLESRLADLSDRARREIEHAVHRVVDKLLHAPTVRVKELAAEPGGHGYAEALRKLFDLDLSTVEAVARPDASGGAASTGDDAQRRAASQRRRPRGKP